MGTSFADWRAFRTNIQNVHEKFRKKKHDSQAISKFFNNDETLVPMYEPQIEKD